MVLADIDEGATDDFPNFGAAVSEPGLPVPDFDAGETDDLPDIPEEESVLPPSASPEEAFEALLQRYPTANVNYLRRFARSRCHVDAALRDLRGRVRQSLVILLQHGGTVVSDEFVLSDGSRMAGNTANVSELKDEGFVFGTKMIDAPSGRKRKRYTLNLSDFDLTAMRRDVLTKWQQKVVATHYGYRCAMCGTHRDLEEDHRVGVVLGMVGGMIEAKTFDASRWQILCRPCNRNKRTACGLCSKQDPEWCYSDKHRCRWASPKDHTHTAGEHGYVLTIGLKPGTGEKAMDLLRAHGLLRDGVDPSHGTPPTPVEDRP